jgi:O-antigen/teichoic acid export membrane protein
MNKEDRKKNIIKDTSKYSLAQYTAQGIGFFIAFFMRKFLGPYQMGIWSLLKVIQGYSSYLQLGIESGAVYRIPFYRGRGDVDSEIETKNTTFTFMFFASLLSAIGLVTAAFLLRNHYSVEITIGLIALALFIILQRMYSFYVVTLRAYRNFSVLTKSLLFDAVVNLLLVLLLVSKFKIYGLYVTICFLAVLNTLFVSKLSGYKMEFNFVFKRIRELTSYGFPILIIGFLSEILATIDIVMIGSMLGVVFVGYYSVAVMAKNCISGLSNNLGIVTIPHMQEVYGKSGKISDIKKFVTYATESVSYILTPLLGLVYFIAPVLIKNFLPKYISGIPALQVLLLNTVFISCSIQAGQFLITLNKKFKLIMINIVAIIFNITVNYFFIKKGFGITGVAVGTSLSSLIVFIGSIILSMKHFASLRETAKFIVYVLFPIVYIIGIIYLCNVYTGTLNYFISAAMSSLIVVFFSIPLYMHIDKKTSIIRLFINIIATRFKG